MLNNTRGIVLQHFKYSESSIIAKIFTEEFGLQSYIVKGIRSKRSRARLALFQPLTLLDLVVYHKESKSLHHLKETSVAFAYQQIPGDVTRRSILLFLNEILFKSLREESPDKALFDWLFNTLTWLDLTDKKVMNFHLLFMIQLSRFLGFYPKRTLGEQPGVFDLQEGQLGKHKPEHPNFVSGIIVKRVEDLLNCPFEEIESLTITGEERRKLIDILVLYYRLHLPGFGEVKSVEVLKTIMG
jgi:DNA repair protein RecO (recombination protein O)